MSQAEINLLDSAAERSRPGVVTLSGVRATIPVVRVGGMKLSFNFKFVLLGVERVAVGGEIKKSPASSAGLKVVCGTQMSAANQT